MNNENLEKRKSFEKGDPRINRDGRPLGVRNRSTIVKEWLEVKKRAKNPLSEQEEDLEVQDMLVLAMIGKALKGDVNAFKELMDSGYGKLLNQHDLTTDGERIQQQPLTLKIVDE